MKLDYVEKTGFFTLHVPRSQKELVSQLMLDHGMDFFTGSPVNTAIMTTKEPYCAASFEEYATDRAKVELMPILAQIAKSWAPDSSIRIACPADKELWGFQKASVAYALARPHTLVGDQPGLGKTPIAICFANEIRAQRVLVICPASIRLQWVKRIREWSTMRFPLSIHPILKGKHGVHPQASWTICSYDLCRTPAIGRAMSRERFDLLILDEAHYLKTSDSQRTRAMFGGGDKREFDAIATRCDRMLCLTGTPLPNRPREAYTLARHLCHDAIDWMSEASFSERYNPSMQMTSPSGKIYIDERSGRHAELQNRLRANFMVRHLKRDVQKQLPQVTLDVVQMDETGPVKLALKAESLLNIDPENLAGVDASIMGHIAAVRHQMGVALAPQAAEYVETILDGGEEKVLVFAHHIAVLDILQKALAHYGLVRVDGSCGPQMKQKAVDDFKSDPSIRVFIGNLSAVGIGTDGLQEVCSRGVFAESSWTPGDNQQGIDRLDRMGQLSAVLFDFLVAPGSISEKILGKSLRKGNTIHKALDKKLKLFN